MVEKTIAIESLQGRLTATIHEPAAGPKQERLSHQGLWPLVMICHGFIGSRMGVNRLFVKAARHFSSLGFKVLRFDYGGCGESDGDYGRGGLHTLISETQSVLNYALNMEGVDPNRIILLGHSLGGATALLTAALDDRVKKLAMWSAVAHPHSDIVNIVGRDEYARLTPDGVIDHNGYGLTAPFFDSLAKHQPLTQLRKFAGDVLIVHGTADEIIPVDYAPLYQNAFWLRGSGSCELRLIFQADHTYSSQKTVDELLQVTGDWLIAVNQRTEEWHDWTI